MRARRRGALERQHAWRVWSVLTVRVSRMATTGAVVHEVLHEAHSMIPTHQMKCTVLYLGVPDFAGDGFGGTIPRSHDLATPKHLFQPSTLLVLVNKRYCMPL